MCFDIHPDHREVKIAKRNIPCYKILMPGNYYRNVAILNSSFILDKNTIISPFKREIYFNIKEKNQFVIKEVNNFSIFSTRADNIPNEIYQGLHSYSNLKEVKVRMHPEDTIHNSFIPKGTKYYYNPSRREYVSLKLRVYRKSINK
jgi:hypothetical protein